MEGINQEKLEAFVRKAFEYDYCSKKVNKLLNDLEQIEFIEGEIIDLNITLYIDKEKFPDAPGNSCMVIITESGSDFNVIYPDQVIGRWTT